MGESVQGIKALPKSLATTGMAAKPDVILTAPFGYTDRVNESSIALALHRHFLINAGGPF